MKKILFIVESLDVGGAELSLLKWVKNTKRKVFVPYVVTFRDGLLRAELEKAGVKVHLLEKRCSFDIFYLLKLIKEIKKINPDVVHCRNGIPAISYGVIASKITGKPVISSVHGRTHYLNLSFKTKIWFRLMRLSDLVITVTKSISEEITRLAKIRKEKVKVIYNGIPLNDFIEKEKKDNFRKNFGLSGHDFVVGTVGSLRTIKGHGFLIESLPIIRREIPNVKLVIIGAGKEEANLRDLVRQLSLEKYVKFLGYREHASQLISLFDIFVLPSLSEGFPNVLLEAMVARTPIIATDVGGVSEIINHSKEGLLISPSNSISLAESIIKLAKNPQLREQLIQNADKRVRESFDIQKMIQQYDQAYLSLVS